MDEELKRLLCAAKYFAKVFCEHSKRTAQRKEGGKDRMKKKLGSINDKISEKCSPKQHS